VYVALIDRSLDADEAHADWSTPSNTTRERHDLIARRPEGTTDADQLVDQRQTLATNGQSGPTLKSVTVTSIQQSGRGQAPDATLIQVSFKSTTSPQDVKTDDLVKHLRNDVLPDLYKARRITSTSTARRRSTSTSRRC